MSKKSKVWKTIPDSKVRIIWACDNDKCKLHNRKIVIPPTFYTNNGTPGCLGCESDLIYVRTEIRK